MWDRYKYYPYFTEEWTKARRNQVRPKVTKLVIGQPR